MKQHRSLFATLLATLTTLFLSNAALALSCATPNAPYLYGEAAWVAQATVLKVNGVERNVDGFGGQAVDVLVKIDRLYKGQPMPARTETNFNPKQRVVFGHVPQIGSVYILFVKLEASPNVLNKALRWLNPDWASPTQIAGKSCYRGDFLLNPNEIEEYLSPIYTFIASLDKPSQGGSVLLEMYSPMPDQLRQQAMRELKLFLKPLDNANTLVKLVQAPSGFFRAANVMPGNYQLVADLPNPRLGLGREWFYDDDAPLAEKVFYRLVQKEGDKSHCIPTPTIKLTVGDRGQVTRRFHFVTVPNESLASTAIKQGACQ